MNPALSSTASKPNQAFPEASRRKGEDNVAWLARHLSAGSERSHVLLVGGRSALDVRLRATQAHVRDDVTPSHWSHVLLLSKLAKEPRNTRIAEISLDPVGGFENPPPNNAVQTGRLRHYGDPEKWPNVALVSVPVAQAEADAALRRFRGQRGLVDAVELLVVWLGFAWGAGSDGNPLVDGRGMPSAALVETVMNAAGYDLTPGLESRSSCPDAIWQAAKWWHEYYAEVASEAPSGCWCIEHRLE